MMMRTDFVSVPAAFYVVEEAGDPPPDSMSLVVFTTRGGEWIFFLCVRRCGRSEVPPNGFELVDDSEVVFFVVSVITSDVAVLPNGLLFLL